jgi:hypothetical protein
VCGSGEDKAHNPILLCDGKHVANKGSSTKKRRKVEVGFHLRCLSPPMKTIPTCDWFCPECVEAKNAAKNATKSPEKDPKGNKEAKKAEEAGEYKEK